MAQLCSQELHYFLVLPSIPAQQGLDRKFSLCPEQGPDFSALLQKCVTELSVGAEALLLSRGNATQSPGCWIFIPLLPCFSWIPKPLGMGVEAAVPQLLALGCAWPSSSPPALLTQHGVAGCGSHLSGEIRSLACSRVADIFSSHTCVPNSLLYVVVCTSHVSSDHLRIPPLLHGTVALLFPQNPNMSYACMTYISPKPEVRQITIKSGISNMN